MSVDGTERSEEPETVHVLPNGHGSTPLAHTDPDCPAIRNRDPTPKPRSVIPDREICSVCRGEVADTASEDPGRIAEGEERDRDVYTALADAGEPLTRRDIEFEAHVSTSQATAALASLRDRGVVDRVENDGDGRKPRYRIARDMIGRGQLTPIGTAVLVGVVATTLTVAIALGVMVP